MNGQQNSSAFVRPKQASMDAKTMLKRITVAAAVGLLVFSVSVSNKRAIESAIDHVYLNLDGALNTTEKGTLVDAVKKIDSALPWTFFKRQGVAARSQLSSQISEFEFRKDSIDRTKAQMPERNSDLSPTMKQYYESSIERDESSYKKSTSALLDKLNYIRRNM